MRVEQVWTLLRSSRCDYLVLHEAPLRWLMVEWIGEKLLDWSAAGFALVDPIAQRIMNAAEARRREVARVPVSPEQLYEINHDWADLWHRIAPDIDEEVWE